MERVLIYLRSGFSSTAVHVRIGVDDLPTILESLATCMPECVTMLSEAATVAEKHLLGKLKQVRQELKEVERIAMTTTGDMMTLGGKVLHKVICSVCGMPHWRENGIFPCISCSASLKVIGPTVVSADAE